MEGRFEVYKAISAVQGELAQIGISKTKKNQQQGYNFRGIDDVYDALAPILAKHKLCILPRVIARNCVERQTQKGNPLFYVTVECEFDLVSAEDGSNHIIRTFGEAMDSADKATNKAMSAAYKYAAFQTFCIPVDVEDADAVTLDVKPQKVQTEKPKPQESKEDVTDFDEKGAIKTIKATLNSKMGSLPASEKKDFYAYATQGKETVDLLNHIISDFDGFFDAWKKQRDDAA
jgi:hypothetical protein